VFAAHVASRTIGGMSQSGTGIHLHGAAVEQDVGRGLDPGIASTHLKDRDGYIVYPHRSILRAPSHQQQRPLCNRSGLTHCSTSDEPRIYRTQPQEEKFATRRQPLPIKL
jgi:hypothetical protein